MKGIPLGCVSLLVECLPQFSHVGGFSLDIMCTCASLLWSILSLNRYLSHCRFSDTVLGNMYVLFVEKKNGMHYNQPTCENRQWEDLYIYIYNFSIKQNNHLRTNMGWRSWLTPHFNNDTSCSSHFQEASPRRFNVQAHRVDGEVNYTFFTLV